MLSLEYRNAHRYDIVLNVLDNTSGARVGERLRNEIYKINKLTNDNN